MFAILAMATLAQAGVSTTTISVDFGIGGSNGLPAGLAPGDVAGVV